jgi:hypothetical protein
MWSSQGFLATSLVGSNIIGQYTFLLAIDIQELKHYRFEFKCKTNRIVKKIQPVLTFDPRSIG